MRHLILLCLALCANSPFLTGQPAPAPCGTAPGKSEWLKSYQSKPQTWANRFNDTLYVPLTLHLVGTSEGHGYYRADYLYPSLCALNRHFAPARIQFYIKGEINYINNDNYYRYNSANVGVQMRRQHNVPNTANCYFVDEARNYCGYYSGYEEGVVIDKSCAAPDSETWAHEMGHFFSLPHTFLGWGNEMYYEGLEVPHYLSNGQEVELQNGSNCGRAGDGFCDTSADYLSFGWRCNEGQQSQILQRDPEGADFRSDGTLIMSYGDCRSRFSEEQMAAMRANLLSEKSALLAGPPTPVAVTAAPTLLQPADGERIEGRSCASLSWNAAPNADAYTVRVKRKYPIGNTVPPQVFATADTQLLVIDIKPGYTYEWTVGAYNRFDGCNAESTPWLFRLAEVGQPAFHLKVYPQPGAPGLPLTVAWELAHAETTQLYLYNASGQLTWQRSTGQPACCQQLPLPVSNLPGGLYFLKVQTASGLTATRKVIIQ